MVGKTGDTMLKFKTGRRWVVLKYESETGPNRWVWDELTKIPDKVRLSKVFYFKRDDLIEAPSVDDLEELDEFTYRFRRATRDGKYWRIEGRKLAIDNDVLIAQNEIEWSRKIFAAERNVSIFRRISKVIGPSREIVIGGDEEARDDVIPVAVFTEMLKKFPGTGELNRYANARVANIVGEYIDPQRDFREQYETYLDRHKKLPRGDPLHAKVLLQTEIEKFELVRNTIVAWLKSSDKNEEQWQKQMLAFLPLIFPKYVAVIEKLPIEDRYTTPGKITRRQIDLALVDVSGNIDVIEIKKPDDDILLRKTRYRDNFVPTGLLSGTVMQAEKYLFYLAKGGLAAEDKLTQKYQSLLPPGLRIKITNPKAMCILGRDRKADGSPALTDGQLADFEIIKRKYANIIDIITYDDLVRRLENILASLRRRKEEGLDEST